MRRMSFALTERQFLAGEKDVTRRLGWAFLRPGDHVLAIRKGMGLARGEKQVVLGEIETVSVRRELLDAILANRDDCRREGYPELRPDEFVSMFCAAMRCHPGVTVTRIEFRRVEA